MKQVLVFLMGSFALLPVMADYNEPGNAGTNATFLVITTNALTDGPHTLARNAESDWFRFELVVSNRYRFESIGASNMDAELYSDSNETTIAASDEGHGQSNNFQLIFQPDVSQTYYLKMYTSDSSAEYELEYQNEPLYDESDAAGETYSNALTLTVSESEQVHGVYTLDSNDKEDWFHFNLIAGADYTFRTVNGGWDTVGVLYYDNTSAIVDDLYTDGSDGDDDYDPADIDNALNFIITYTPPVSGDYYLKVIGYKVGYLNYSLICSRGPLPDTDGDGMLDVDEAIAGTNPNDDTSYFAITNWSSENLIIEWPSFSGRVYRVYWTDNMTNAFQQLGPIIPGPQNSYTDITHAAEASGFYKVDVRLQ